jgi:hypothetical protein
MMDSIRTLSAYVEVLYVRNSPYLPPGIEEPCAQVGLSYKLDKEFVPEAKLLTCHGA